MVTVPPLPVNGACHRRLIVPTGIPHSRLTPRFVSPLFGVTAYRLAGGREENEVIGRDDVGIAQPGAEATLPTLWRRYPLGLSALVGPVAAPPPVEAVASCPPDWLFCTPGCHRRSCRCWQSRSSFVQARAHQNACGRATDCAVSNRDGTRILDRDADLVAGDGEPLAERFPPLTSMAVEVLAPSTFKPDIVRATPLAISISLPFRDAGA